MELIFHSSRDIEEYPVILFCEKSEVDRMIDLFQEIKRFTHPAVTDLGKKLLPLFIQSVHFLTGYKTQFHLIGNLPGKNRLFFFKQIRIIIDQIHTVVMLLPVWKKK